MAIFILHVDMNSALFGCRTALDFATEKQAPMQLYCEGDGMGIVRMASNISNLEKNELQKGPQKYGPKSPPVV